MAFILKKVKPSEILVKYGLGAGGAEPKVKRGGLAFVIPVLQGAKTMSLEPFVVDIQLQDALDKNNIRVNIPSTFTLAINDDEKSISIAAKRLLEMSDAVLDEQVKDIILGQFRGVLAGMTVEEINSDREKFEALVESSIKTELDKIGIQIMNFNITDVTDNADYINNLGREAAARVESEAKIKTSKAVKEGIIGEETNKTETAIKEAELKKDRTVRTAELEKERVEKETQYAAELAEAQKENQIRTANAAKEVSIKKIEFNKDEEVARSEANILKAEKKREEELAQKRAEEIVTQEIEKERQIIVARTEAEKVVLEAKAKADAIRLEAEAEAERIGKIADAKAKGFDKMANAVGKENIVNVMLAENVERLAEIQADALKSIEIDKITIIDSGSNEGGSGLNGFVDNFMKSAPSYQALAESTGIEVETLFGSVKATDDKATDDTTDEAVNVPEDNVEELK